MAVRNERVILSLQDNFSGDMAKAAGTTALLNRELKNLSGQELQAARTSQMFVRDVQRVGREANGTAKEIDRLSGRVGILLDALAIVGPGVVAASVVATPAITGLAAQLGFATAGAAGFLVAVQGLGDALKAMNTAHLDPTTENLSKARLEMEKLSPAGQDLTRQLFGLRDEWKQLRNVSQEALFPGLSAALDDMETRLPDFERILSNVNTAVGEMLADGADSLASPRWDDFFTFIATDAPPAISSMGTALGSVAHAMSELWMAFDPLNDGFATWLMDATAGLDRWAQGLDQTEGFQSFVDYIRDTGPQVVETLGAVALAVIRIGEAAAPLGGPVLAALEGVAEAIGALAGSDAGPAIMASVTALALLRRGMAGFEAVQRTTWAQGIKGADTFGQRVAAARSPLLKTGAALGGIALATSGAAEGFGLANTASGALLGTMGGPWGAAIGGAVGLMLDLSNSTGGFEVNADSLTATLNQQTGAITENTTAYAANELEKQGVLKAAQALGLSLADVTQASLGDAAAQDRVTASLAAQDAAFFDANGRVMVGTEALMAHRDSAGQVENAIGTMSGQVENGQTRIRRMADATDAATGSLTRAETAAQDFSDAVTRLNNVLSGRASMRDYEAAVDDFTKSLKDNGRTFDINTEKGRANQAALDAIASTTLRVAEGLKDAARQRFLTAAIADLRNMGEQFGVPKSQIQILIKMLRAANDTRVNPKITADTIAAMTAIERVRNALAGIKDKSVTVRVTQTGAGVTPGFGPVGSARGSTVPDAPGPYRDQFLYALAQREEVVSNDRGQADRFRPALKAINANMPRDIIRGMLAHGGTAGDKETEAQKIAREHREQAKAKAEEARRRRDEREAREEEKRQRQLDRQRTKDLLASDLRDEREQARLEVLDARRRLRSARKADRPRDEIREARLALKGERADVQDMAAQKQIDAAEAQLQAAEQNRDNALTLHDSLADSVSGQFSNSLTGGGLAGLGRTLSKDIAGGSAMSSTLQALVAAGLDTTGAAAGLFQELASSNDTTTAQQLLGAGPDAISFYEQQFAQRAAINQARGSFVADASYGQMLAQQTAAVAVAQQAAAAAEVSAARLEGRIEALQGAVEQQANEFAAALNAVAAGAGRGGSGSGWPNKGGWGK